MVRDQDGRKGLKGALVNFPKHLTTALFTVAMVALMVMGTGAQAEDGWRELETGLELGQFDSRTLAPAAQGDLVILRVQPEQWELNVYARENQGLDALAWCKELGLVAAVNAGMFQADRKTHVGFCKIDGKVTNKGTEMWREAALGEDEQGRSLLIYCDRRMSMFDFNEMLLKLSLGLVAAQHLEGSGPAKLWIDHPSVDRAKLPEGGNPGVVLPNILGVAKRHPQPSE